MIVVLFILVAILFIWAISSARRANTTADANQELLNTPRLNVSYTIGGPQRFAEEFTSALEESDTAENPLSVDDRVWAALLIGNQGFVDADDVELNVPLADGLEPVVVAEMGGFAGIEVEETENGLSFDLGDVDEGDTTYVFLGFEPGALANDAGDSWATSFRTTVGTITAESGDATATFYGSAL